MAWVPANYGPHPPLPWYDLLESPEAARQQEEESLSHPASPENGPQPLLTLAELSALVVNGYVVEEARRENLGPALDVLCCPVQFPPLEPATASAVQAVVSHGHNLSEEQWERISPEVVEVLQLLRGLRRAEGISTFLGPCPGIMQAREILACAQEGLRERHERLSKAISDIVHRLLLNCLRGSAGQDLHNLQDVVIWDCAHSIAAQKMIDLLRSPSWVVLCSSGTFSDRVEYIIRNLFQMDARREAELERAQRCLDHVLPMEAKLRNAMAVVRALWRTISASAPPPSVNDPMQDKHFLGGLHGRTWLRDHAGAYIHSFQAPAHETMRAAFDSIAPLYGF